MIGNREQPSGAPHPWRESLGYAREGLDYVWRTQRNLRFEAAAGLAAAALAALLAAPVLPIVLVSGLVLCLEVVNTAVEAVVDLVTPTYHPLAKVAKDASAGAVLLASITSLLVGVITLGPPLWRLAAHLLGR